MTTLADLIAEVAADHVEDPNWPGRCGWCHEPWRCKPARLAAALSPENVAAGLRTGGFSRPAHAEIDAAALLAAMKA